MGIVVWIVLGLFLGVTRSAGDSAGIDVTSYYLKESCGGTPNRVDSYVNEGACNESCDAYESVWKSANQSCNATNYEEVVAASFGGASFLLIEKFEEDCEVFSVSSALLVSDKCEQVIKYLEDWGFATYEKIRLEDNGSVSVRYFTNDDCT
jgi:hypothetical protein